MPASLWRHRDFRLLWAGQTVSEVGTQVSFLAVPLVAIDIVHASTFGVGLLAAMQTLPFLLVGLPAGAWVDRMARRPVLIAADIGRTVALGSIPAAWALSALTLAQLYIVSLVAGILTVFFDVAYQSYLPVLVGHEHLVDGNAKLATSESGARVVGPAVAGGLVSAVGAANAVLADAASFVVSFATLLAIRTPEERPEAAPAPRGRARRLKGEIAEGLRFVWREPRIRSVAGSTSTSNFFSVMAMAVLLVFLRRQLHLSAGRIGVLEALGSVGGIVGALAAGRLARRIGVGRTILWTIAVSGLGQMAYPLATRATASILVVVGGVLTAGGAVAYNINQVSLRQALCPPRLLGRMNASVRFMVWGSMPIGGFVGGVLGSTIGLRPTLWVAAAGSLAAFGWILFSPVPAVRTIPTPEELAGV
ncbi:MAG TPA: MFS transporter [Acidimicrobiales bacterium]|jgi:MFS family permease|nr:MFS transporter [Acidimicrobiales bacterium]